MMEAEDYAFAEMGWEFLERLTRDILPDVLDDVSFTLQVRM
jgi:hypothetical protein